MAAATSERDTKRQGNALTKLPPIPVAADEIIYVGTIVMLDGNNQYGVAGTGVASRVVWGIATETVDATGLASGAVSVPCERGIFKLANLSGDVADGQDIGKLVYVADNQSVGVTATDRSAAGPVVKVESDGVWVSIDPLARV